MTADRTERARGVALAVAAGALAMVAAARSPLAAGVPPLVPPYVPLDLRFVTLPALFGASEALAGHRRDALGDVATLAPAVLAATLTQVHASALLAFAGNPIAAPGTFVDPLGFGAAAASVLVALAVTFRRAGDRFAEELDDRGVPTDQVDRAQATGEALARSGLVTAAGALVVLGLGLRAATRLLAGAALPLHEVVALALVLALGAVYAGYQGQTAGG